MAHQADNIPWHDLASTLYWVNGGTNDASGINDITNLNARPGEAEEGNKKLGRFVEAFAKNIDKHSRCERRKYPKKYDPPQPDDVILDERIVEKILPTVERWWREFDDAPKYCFSDDEEEGKPDTRPIIPDEETRASAFLRQHQENGCREFFKLNERAFYNLEIVKTLILEGEMDAILRVCAHPNVDLKSWWRQGQCMCVWGDVGWKMLCDKALMAYICLNVLYCFPETCDEASGKTTQMDYRQTRCYQYMMMRCTQNGDTSDIPTYPHRQFLGMPKRDNPPEHLREWAKRVYEYPCGMMPIEKFLSLEGLMEYQPHGSDVQYVRWLLCRQGLPVELALEIMEFAKYKPKRTLKVPHDPLHQENRKELEQYLEHCWQILVRCNMIAKVLGIRIGWEDMVGICIVDLYRKYDSISSMDSSQCRLVKWLEDQAYYHGD